MKCFDFLFKYGMLLFWYDKDCETPGDQKEFMDVVYMRCVEFCIDIFYCCVVIRTANY